MAGQVPRYAIVPGEILYEGFVASACVLGNIDEVWSVTRWYHFGYYDNNGDWNEEWRDVLVGYEGRWGGTC